MGFICSFIMYYGFGKGSKQINQFPIKSIKEFAPWMIMTALVNDDKPVMD